MSEIPRQEGPPPENGGPTRNTKHTCLVCSCIGCFVALLTLTIAGLLYWSLLMPFLRELLAAAR
mgnify:CR=1 FL=1